MAFTRYYDGGRAHGWRPGMTLARCGTAPACQDLGRQDGLVWRPELQRDGRVGQPAAGEIEPGDAA